jgi:hypothetical protein
MAFFVTGCDSCYNAAAMSKSENTNTIQTISRVVLTGVALLALFRDDKRVGIALAVVAITVILPTYFGPTKTKLKAWNERHSRDRYAREAWPELAIFYNRFFEFLFENNGSLPQGAKDITQSRSPDKEYLYPANSWSDLFRLLKSYFDQAPVPKEAPFSRGVIELNEYATAYTLAFDRMAQKLRQPPWSEKLTPDQKRIYAADREKWCAFIDEWMTFTRKADIRGFKVHREFWKPEMLA